jgi:CBS domain-containing protein
LPTGVITDRDIVVEVVARGASPDAITVGDTIRRDLVTVPVDADVHVALREMRQAGIRRVPVVDGNGKLVGILSLDDVIRHIAKQLNEVAETVRREQDVEARTLT